MKNIWSVGVSSVPRIYDLHANNPGTNILELLMGNINITSMNTEHDNMELTVTQATTEGRVTSSVSTL